MFRKCCNIYWYAGILWIFPYQTILGVFFKVVEKGKTAPLNGQIKSFNQDIMIRCGIECTKTTYCDSISYNPDSKHCILQSSRSTDPDLLPIDATGYKFGDREPPLPLNETKPGKSDDN